MPPFPTDAPLAPLCCVYGACPQCGIAYAPAGRCVRCGRIVDTTRLPKAIERERTDSPMARSIREQMNSIETQGTDGRPRAA